MLTLGRVLCGLGYALLLAFSTASAQSVYTDNFDAGPQLPWSNLRGDWQATAGEFAAQAPTNTPPTATLLPLELSDFSFELDVLDVADGGLWLRTDPTANAGVLLVLFPDRIYWHVISSVAGPYTIYQQASITPNLGAGATRLRVTARGPILRAYLRESATAITTLDLRTVSVPPGLNYLSGRVGLYDNAAPGTRFDNVRLQPGVPIEVMAVGDANTGAVHLFPADAEGNAEPIATLAGPATGLLDIRGVAMDADMLYVSSGAGQYVKAFALNNLGNVAATRMIKGPTTGLGSVYQFALAHDELYVSSDTGPVSVFGAQDDGDVAPRRTITAMTGAYALDHSLGEVFVARHFVDADSIYAYADNAGGATPPLRQLTASGGANLGLASTATELFVSQYLNAKVQVYARNASGAAAPLRTMAGPATGLGANADVALWNDQLYVANTIGQVLVFASGANGDVAPLRVIAGPATGLVAPFALAFGVWTLPDAILADGFE
ncbi:MAG: hypothetical protein AB7E72_07675 [Lysobacterales bacterium]